MSEMPIGLSRRPRARGAARRAGALLIAASCLIPVAVRARGGQQQEGSPGTAPAQPPATRGAVPLSYVRGEPLEIGNTLQLLADDYVVEDRWMLTRKVGTVYKFMRNPVLVQDKPWEDNIGGYPCVLYDERMRKFRMWYQCFDLTNYFARQGPSYYVGYAESDDGFNWTKPALDGFPFGGYEKTKHRDHDLGTEGRLQPQRRQRLGRDGRRPGILWRVGRHPARGRRPDRRGGLELLDGVGSRRLVTRSGSTPASSRPR